ncbi:NAD(P)/FAD-dependent oxidoreductase [Haloarcula nitratireducens]|uniref:FAD-dependent oxidoreductase n=1 Tax=Haloarcula nitratireducens TaxID=2487749 RepID=A0AAW4P8Y2_9EURY|nr:FAD-dependent oxidoreductase [Halomicroarcula nitratireducens]MBX0294339.1 FAD-dependent oxidoreductase [Halomicroarcula nitratireducens]
MTATLAVVGAGAAGAAATYALRDASVEVTVLEKSRGVCGRAATRRRDDCVYEYGANYLKDADDRVTELVTDELPTDGLVDVDDPIYAFERDGEIREGKEADEHKWTYEAGITQLAKRLFAETEANVRNEVTVETLERVGDGWRIYDDEGTDFGRYDGVLLTPPAPQTADILGQAEWSHDDRRSIRQTVASVPYRTAVAGVLHYPFELDVPWYAAVNTDKDHDVGWVAREECKSGHVPDGESLLLVQMNEGWSVANYDERPDALVERIARRTAHLLDDDRLTDPDWTDHQHWRYSQSEATVDHDEIATARDHDLFFAGDWVAGESRLHAALRNGLDTGEAIADTL